jgi:hypothetical protein
LGVPQFNVELASATAAAFFMMASASGSLVAKRTVVSLSWSPAGTRTTRSKKHRRVVDDNVLHTDSQ